MFGKDANTRGSHRDRFTQRALAAWLAFARRHSSALLAAIVATAALSLLLVSLALKRTTPPTNHLAPNSIAARQWRAFQQEFPSVHDLTLELSGWPKEPLTTAAEQLLTELQSRPTCVEQAYVAMSSSEPPTLQIRASLKTQRQELVPRAESLDVVNSLVAAFQRERAGLRIQCAGTIVDDIEQGRVRWRRVEHAVGFAALGLTLIVLLIFDHWRHSAWCLAAVALHTLFFLAMMTLWQQRLSPETAWASLLGLTIPLFAYISFGSDYLSHRETSDALFLSLTNALGTMTRVTMLIVATALAWDTVGPLPTRGCGAAFVVHAAVALVVLAIVFPLFATLLDTPSEQLITTRPRRGTLAVGSWLHLPASILWPLRALGVLGLLASGTNLPLVTWDGPWPEPASTFNNASPFEALSFRDRNQGVAAPQNFTTTSRHSEPDQKSNNTIAPQNLLAEPICIPVESLDKVDRLADTLRQSNVVGRIETGLPEQGALSPHPFHDQRFRGPSGQRAMYVYLAAHAFSPSSRQRFVQEVLSLAPGATGPAVVREVGRKELLRNTVAGVIASFALSSMVLLAGQQQLATAIRGLTLLPLGLLCLGTSAGAWGIPLGEHLPLAWLALLLVSSLAAVLQAERESSATQASAAGFVSAHLLLIFVFLPGMFSSFLPEQQLARLALAGQLGILGGVLIWGRQRRVPSVVDTIPITALDLVIPQRSLSSLAHTPTAPFAPPTTIRPRAVIRAAS